MRSRITVNLVVALVVLLGCRSDTAQLGTASDAISVEYRFSIGSLEDPFTPDMETEFAVTDSYVVAGGVRGLLHLFDHEGRLVRELNLLGEGPGELSGAGTPFALGADTVIVVDRGSGRFARIDLSSDMVLDAGSIGVPFGEVALGPAGWLAGTYRRIEWISAQGQRTTLLELSEQEARQAGPPLVAWSGQSAVWSPREAYRMNWGTPGSDLGIVAYEPEFFRTSASRPGQPNTAAIGPWIVRLASSSDDHVWVVSVMPTGVEGNLKEMFTTQVERLDLRAGRPSADTLLSGMYSITRDGEWLYEFDASGELPRLSSVRL
jgi:hypothetical protein